MPGVHVVYVATNDHACILIWDVHMCMGHNIGPYAYGISHTRMGRPIRVYGPIYAYGAEQKYPECCTINIQTHVIL